MTDQSDTRRGQLAVRHLTAGYGGVPVIYEVSMDAAAGQVTTVIGPNGAGKSTLLKAILGQCSVTAGSIRVGDKLVSGLSTNEIARSGVGYVPQVKEVFEDLTVTENLEMGGYTLPRREVPDRIEWVFTVFPALAGMASRPAAKLSGGERKMLAIGRVLMTQPHVLVLDEPTAGLSPRLADELLQEHVPGLARAGTALLLVEQRAMAALAISDWAYVMVSGKVELTMPAAQLLEQTDLGDVFLDRAASNTR